MLTRPLSHSSVQDASLLAGKDVSKGSIFDKRRQQKQQQQQEEGEKAKA
jgi:hypothetical protein